MGVKHISSTEEAQRLAAELNSTRRDRPYVVVSTPAAQSTPYVDPGEISEEVGDLARVYVLPAGDESWAFSKAMPQQTQVYGGAGRAYPVGTSWVHKPYDSPLRFAFDAVEGRDATRALITDALRMANEAGLLARSKHPLVKVEAEVKSLVRPSRAIVRTSSGVLASIHLELLFPQLEVDQVFRLGMRLSGSLDPEKKRYDAAAMRLSPREALSEYQPGDVVLVEVVETSEDRATLRLHPDVDATVVRDEVTSNELDQVSSLMSVGEVLAARVVEIGPRWPLSLLDVDDDEEPKQAPSLLTGGPPWLTQTVPAPPLSVPDSPAALLEPLPLAPERLQQVDTPDAVASVEEQTTAPTTVRPAATPSPLLLDRHRHDRPAPAAEVAALRRDLDKAVSAEHRMKEHNASLLRDLAALRHEHQMLHNQFERTKESLRTRTAQLSESRTALRKARQKAERSDRGQRREQLFLDPEEEFRFDVYLAWVSRVPAAEKPQRPLPEYLIGPDFVDSVEQIEGVDRSKIADVAFEVVMGLADRMPGRDMHQLREGRNGDAPAVVREDGAKCWRVALQVNRPQARRLHFWRMGNGQVELSRVTLHDDFTP